MTYIHENDDWPRFRWQSDALSDQMAHVRHRQGRLIGRMESLGFPLRSEAILQTLTTDVLKTSAIEGEKLDQGQVRSSIARRMGLDIGALSPASRDVEGIVNMMLDATQNFEQVLTIDRLFGWHASLFPTEKSGLNRISVGTWRTDTSGPMQVVSGPIGREHVHFEAPATNRLDQEMTMFLEWFNGANDMDWVLKAGIAHFWFVTIHPFDDGNGRIARTIADLALARSEASAQRFYSMSAQIERERQTYYEQLEQAQKGSMDITPWLHWFLECLERSIDGAEAMLSTVLNKARFWNTNDDLPFNDRQRKILNLLLDGFEGKLTSSKWARIAKCSQDTALRDIDQLLIRGLLMKDDAGGRSTNYRLA